MARSVEDWTPQEVHDWFRTDFPDFAAVLLSEEVDGEALLELQAIHLRDEPFKLKMGKAVMVKRELERLKEARDNGTAVSKPVISRARSTPTGFTNEVNSVSVVTTQSMNEMPAKTEGAFRGKTDAPRAPPRVAAKVVIQEQDAEESEEDHGFGRQVSEESEEHNGFSRQVSEESEEDVFELKAMQIVTPIGVKRRDPESGLEFDSIDAFQQYREKHMQKGKEWTQDELEDAWDRCDPVVIESTKDGKEQAKSVTIATAVIKDLVQQMLEHANQNQERDMEVAVVSVMGKFRGGKSFLLNILATYFGWLEANQETLSDDPRHVQEYRIKDTDANLRKQGRSEKASTDWLPEWLPQDGIIDTPFSVDAKSDVKTCTLGLWLLNKPFFLRSPVTLKKVAVLLMDSQGADDGYLDEAQSRAILGITTVFSSTVIYNVKMPLDTKHVKDLADLAQIFQEALSDVVSDAPPPPAETLDETANAAAPKPGCVFGRLFFFLRDAKFEKDQMLKDCKEKVCKDAENKLSPIKATVNRDLVKQLHKSFDPLDIYGLPFPGDSADFAKSAKTNNIKELNDNFKYLLDEFVRSTFEPQRDQDNDTSHSFPVPVKTCLTNKTLTARGLVSYLERIKDGFAGCMVAGGDPELIAMHREELAEGEFEKAMEELLPELHEEFPKAEIKKKTQEHAQRLKATLESKGIASSRKWIMKFESFCEGHAARRQNKYNEKQNHGDRAIMGTAAVCVVGYATPLGGIAAAHWGIATVGGAAASAGGYYRHTMQNHHDILSEEAAKSYAQTGYERGFDAMRSCKRYLHKGQNVCQTVNKVAATRVPASAD